jgi:hypothetical protein
MSTTPTSAYARDTHARASMRAQTPHPTRRPTLEELEERRSAAAEFSQAFGYLGEQLAASVLNDATAPAPWCVKLLRRLDVAREAMDRIVRGVDEQLRHREAAS